MLIIWKLGRESTFSSFCLLDREVVSGLLVLLLNSFQEQQQCFGHFPLSLNYVCFNLLFYYNTLSRLVSLWYPIDTDQLVTVIWNKRKKKERNKVMKEEGNNEVGKMAGWLVGTVEKWLESVDGGQLHPIISKSTAYGLGYGWMRTFIVNFGCRQNLDRIYQLAS